MLERELTGTRSSTDEDYTTNDLKESGILP